MRILGIETSCDETAVAVVEDGQKLLAWAMASSVAMHEKTKGIIPEQAAREQVKAILPTIDEALNQLEENTGSRGFDVLAVTHGPGLIGSLLIGVETAKALSWVWRKPLVPVNHLIGHVYANFLETPQLPQFPFIALIVSGGHTDLILMEDHGKWRFLGGTRDDAAGEAFDKVARLLGLGFPGGPAIQQAASQLQPFPNSPNSSYSPNFPNLPRPMLHSGDYDFSFSGLKTAMADQIQQFQQGLNPVSGFNPEKRLSEKGIVMFAIAFQEAVVEILVKKTLEAAAASNAKAILLSGGVAANARLRERLQHEAQVRVFVPQVRFCTDNGAMVAAAAHFNYNPVNWKTVNANPGLALA